MPEALTVRALAKDYAGHRALDGVDLTIAPGELFGLLGPNGAGKSTLVKIVCGLVNPSGGEVSVCGHRAGSLDANRTIGYLPELFRYPDWATATEVMRLHQRLTGSHGGDGERRELLTLVGLGNAMDKKVDQMSKGMQQRLGMAQAMMTYATVVTTSMTMTTTTIASTATTTTAMATTMSITAMMT